jgi:hypothetical protein
MENYSKNQMLKSIDVLRETTQNCMQISMESYAEIMAKLDLLSFLITEKNSK